MASITLTIPTQQAQRVLDSFAARKGFSGFASDGTTPQTKTEFLKQELINFVKKEVALYEAQEAANAAASTAQNDVQNNISIS